MPPLTVDNFKDAVALYVSLHDELTRSAKELKALRSQKVELGDEILAFMREQEIDSFQMGDGKLRRHTCKRAESVKKEHFLESLKDVCPDEATCEQVYQNTMAKRRVELKDVLKRTSGRGK